MNNSQLTTGDLAPQFTTVDAFGKPVDLTDYKDSHVLLVFMRYAGCPFCNLTLHRLTMEYPMLRDSGCKVIAVVQSDAARIQTDVYDRHKHRPQYPIIPDLSKKLYGPYGVRSSKKAIAKSFLDIPYWLKSAYTLGFKQTKLDSDSFLVPATFLIGPGEQRIVKAEYNSSFYDHRTFTAIYEPLVFKQEIS